MSAECKSPILKLETENPNESLLRKALVELRETPQNIEKGLQELKILLEAEKNLVVPISNDEWLLLFLRRSKFYPESARDWIKTFFAVRHKYPEVKTLLLPSKLKQVFDANLVSILPQRDQHGRRIITLLHGKICDHNVISIEEILGSGILCSELLYKEPATQINGVVYIYDLEDISFKQLLKFTPKVLKRSLDFIQDHNAMRLKGFHIVNQPTIFQPLFAALKPYFSAKGAERIHMHGNNYESLHRYIAPECLPKCYGGSLETQLMYSHESFQLMTQYEKDFQEFQKYGIKTITK